VVCKSRKEREKGGLKRADATLRTGRPRKGDSLVPAVRQVRREGIRGHTGVHMGGLEEGGCFCRDTVQLNFPEKSNPRWEK